MNCIPSSSESIQVDLGLVKALKSAGVLYMSFTYGDFSGHYDFRRMSFKPNWICRPTAFELLSLPEAGRVDRKRRAVG